MSSQIWCYLKFPKRGVVGGWWEDVQKSKAAQNGVKHGLILEFLRSDDIFEISWVSLTSRQTSIQIP